MQRYKQVADAMNMGWCNASFNLNQGCSETKRMTAEADDGYTGDCNANGGERPYDEQGP